MPFPWLQVLDAVIGVTDIARSRRISKMRDQCESTDLAPARSAAPGGLEARLAGVVVAALKEAFERDTRRLDLEREQMEAERRRAERALKLELARQSGDREIGRLRLIAGIDVAVWIGMLLFVTRLASAPVGARFSFAVGWLLLLGSIGASFNAQAQVARELERLAQSDSGVFDGKSASASGSAAVWLLVAALAVIGLVAVAL